MLDSDSESEESEESESTAFFAAAIADFEGASSEEESLSEDSLLDSFAGTPLVFEALVAAFAAAGFVDLVFLVAESESESEPDELEGDLAFLGAATDLEGTSSSESSEDSSLLEPFGGGATGLEAFFSVDFEGFTLDLPVSLDTFAALAIWGYKDLREGANTKMKGEDEDLRRKLCEYVRN